MKRYVPEEIVLDEKQHAEMSQIHSLIDETASSDLESVFEEGECQGTEIGSALRHVWEQDKRARHEEAQKCFQADQQRNSECSFTYI